MKIKHRHTTSLRLLVVIVCLCFTAEQFAMAALNALGTNVSSFERLPIQAFELSDDIARIEDRFIARPALLPNTGNEKLIILIQDAHENYSGQLNTAKTLEAIFKTNKLPYVFLEAGNGKESISFLRKYSDVEKRKKIGLNHLRKGLIQGSEYFDLISNSSFQLWGVEDPGLYNESLKTYREIVGIRESGFEYLNKIQSAIDLLKRDHYSPELQAFDSLHQRYLKEEVAFSSYISELAHIASKNGIEFQNLRQLQLIHSLLKDESTIDFSQTNLEYATAISESIKFNPSTPDQNNVSEAQLQAFKTNRTGINSETLLRLTDGLEAGGINWKVKYPMLSKYVQYLNKTERVDVSFVLDQKDLLEEKIWKLLSIGYEDKSLIQIDKSIRIIRKFFELKMTPKEYKILSELYPVWNLETTTAFLNKLIMNSGKNIEKIIFIKSDFEEMMSLSERFYKLTRERDDVFIKNMFGKLSEANSSVGILIAGGYHSANLKERLRQMNVSYLSIQPNIAHETDHNQYEKRLMAQNYAEQYYSDNATKDNTSGVNQTALMLKRLDRTSEDFISAVVLPIIRDPEVRSRALRELRSEYNSVTSPTATAVSAARLSDDSDTDKNIDFTQRVTDLESIRLRIRAIQKQSSALNNDSLPEFKPLIENIKNFVVAIKLSRTLIDTSGQDDVLTEIEDIHRRLLSDKIIDFDYGLIRQLTYEILNVTRPNQLGSNVLPDDLLLKGDELQARMQRIQGYLSAGTLSDNIDEAIKFRYELRHKIQREQDGAYKLKLFLLDLILERHLEEYLNDVLSDENLRDLMKDNPDKGIDLFSKVFSLAYLGGNMPRSIASYGHMLTDPRLTINQLRATLPYIANLYSTRIRTASDAYRKNVLGVTIALGQGDQFLDFFQELIGIRQLNLLKRTATIMEEYVIEKLKSGDVAEDYVRKQPVSEVSEIPDFVLLSDYYPESGFRDEFTAANQRLVNDYSLRSTFGVKGESALVMAGLGFNTPSGFLIPTTIHRHDLRNKDPNAFNKKMDSGIKELESEVSLNSGVEYSFDISDDSTDSVHPLLLSVKASSVVPIHEGRGGLNGIGFNSTVRKRLKALTGDEQFVNDIEIRFIEDYGVIIFGIPRNEFTEILDVYREEFDQPLRKDLAPHIQTMILDAYKKLLKEYGKEIPENPREQLDQVITSFYHENAVVNSDALGGWGVGIFIQQSIYPNQPNSKSGGGILNAKVNENRHVDVSGEVMVGGFPHDFGDRRTGVTTNLADVLSQETLKTAEEDGLNPIQIAALYVRRFYGRNQQIKFIVQNEEIYYLSSRDAAETFTKSFPVLAEEPEVPKATGVPVYGGAFRGVAVYNQSDVSSDDVRRIVEDNNLDGVILWASQNTREEILAEADAIFTGGGATSEVAVFAIQNRTPAIGGITNRYKKEIPNRSIISFDAATGRIFEGRIPTQKEVEMLRLIGGLPQLTDLDEADLTGKKVLVRVDFNVPTDGNKILDDLRIRSTLPTIRYLTRRGAKVVLMAHKGRPKGEPSDKDQFSLEITADYLRDEISDAERGCEAGGCRVLFSDTTIGPERDRQIEEMKNGDILVLENLRFDKREKIKEGKEAGSQTFADQLFKGFDIYVNASYGTAHNGTDVSTTLIPISLPAYVGPLMTNEVVRTMGITRNPDRPYVVILGGAKVSDKLPTIKSALDRMKAGDSLAVQGAMAFTFLKILHEDSVPNDNPFLELQLEQDVRQVMEEAKSKGVNIILPKDLMLADEFKRDAQLYVSEVRQSEFDAYPVIPEGKFAVDAGPNTEEELLTAIKTADTVFWNGPVGAFDLVDEAAASQRIMMEIAAAKNFGVNHLIGGGDTANIANEVIENHGIPSKSLNVATGGGASIAVVTGTTLPALSYLAEHTARRRYSQFSQSDPITDESLNGRIQHLLRFYQTQLQDLTSVYPSLLSRLILKEIEPFTEQNRPNLKQALQHLISLQDESDEKKLGNLSETDKLYALHKIKDTYSLNRIEFALLRNASDISNMVGSRLAINPSDENLNQWIGNYFQWLSSSGDTRNRQHFNPLINLFSLGDEDLIFDRNTVDRWIALASQHFRGKYGEVTVDDWKKFINEVTVSAAGILSIVRQLHEDTPDASHRILEKGVTVYLAGEGIAWSKAHQLAVPNIPNDHYMVNGNDLRSEDFLQSVTGAGREQLNRRVFAGQRIDHGTLTESIFQQMVYLAQKYAVDQEDYFDKLNEMFAGEMTDRHYEEDPWFRQYLYYGYGGYSENHSYFTELVRQNLLRGAAFEFRGDPSRTLDEAQASLLAQYLPIFQSVARNIATDFKERVIDQHPDETTFNLVARRPDKSLSASGSYVPNNYYLTLFIKQAVEYYFPEVNVNIRFLQTLHNSQYPEDIGFINRFDFIEGLTAPLDHLESFNVFENHQDPLGDGGASVIRDQLYTEDPDQAQSLAFFLATNGIGVDDLLPSERDSLPGAPEGSIWQSMNHDIEQQIIATSFLMALDGTHNEDIPFRDVGGEKIPDTANANEIVNLWVDNRQLILNRVGQGLDELKQDGSIIVNADGALLRFDRSLDEDTQAADTLKELADTNVPILLVTELSTGNIEQRIIQPYVERYGSWPPNVTLMSRMGLPGESRWIQADAFGNSAEIKTENHQNWEPSINFYLNELNLRSDRSIYLGFSYTKDSGFGDELQLVTGTQVYDMNFVSVEPVTQRLASLSAENPNRDIIREKVIHIGNNPKDAHSFIREITELINASRLSAEYAYESYDKDDSDFGIRLNQVAGKASRPTSAYVRFNDDVSFKSSPDEPSLSGYLYLQYIQNGGIKGAGRVLMIRALERYFFNSTTVKIALSVASPESRILYEGIGFESKQLIKSTAGGDPSEVLVLDAENSEHVQKAERWMYEQVVRYVAGFGMKGNVGPSDSMIQKYSVYPDFESDVEAMKQSGARLTAEYTYTDFYNEDSDFGFRLFQNEVSGSVSTNAYVKFNDDIDFQVPSDGSYLSDYLYLEYIQNGGIKGAGRVLMIKALESYFFSDRPSKIALSVVSKESHDLYREIGFESRSLIKSSTGGFPSDVWVLDNENPEHIEKAELWMYRQVVRHVAGFGLRGNVGPSEAAIQKYSDYPSFEQDVEAFKEANQNGARLALENDFGEPQPDTAKLVEIVSREISEQAETFDPLVARLIVSSTHTTSIQDEDWMALQLSDGPTHHLLQFQPQTDVDGAESVAVRALVNGTSQEVYRVQNIRRILEKRQQASSRKNELSQADVMRRTQNANQAVKEAQKKIPNLLTVSNVTPTLIQWNVGWLEKADDATIEMLLRLFAKKYRDYRGQVIFQLIGTGNEALKKRFFDLLALRQIEGNALVNQGMIPKQFEGRTYRTATVQSADDFDNPSNADRRVPVQTPTYTPTEVDVYPYEAIINFTILTSQIEFEGEKASADQLDSILRAFEVLIGRSISPVEKSKVLKMIGGTSIDMNEFKLALRTFSIKPLARVSLNAAARIMRLTLQMVKQSA